MVLIKNKKGVTKLLGVSMDLVITAAVIIILVLFVLIPLYNIFTGSPNQGTMESFLQIDKQIKDKLIGGTASNIELPFYIQDNKLIAAFNKGEAYAHWKHPLAPDSVISRPKEGICSMDDMPKGACLCLCDNNYNNKNSCNNPVKCFMYENFDYILAASNMKCNYGIEAVVPGAAPEMWNYLVIVGDTALSSACRTQVLSIYHKNNYLFFAVK